MPYTVSWHDPSQTILQIHITGENTWDHFLIAMDEVAAHLHETDQRVDLLLIQQAAFPKGNPLPHMRTSANKLKAYTHLGSIVVVDEARSKTLARMFIDIVLRTFPGSDENMARFRFVETLDEALATIARNRVNNAL
jgi:hypothetical protein